MTITIKLFKPSDPKISDMQHSEWFRDYMKIDSIEQIDGDPSAYFIMSLKKPFSDDSRNFRIIVKHKNFFREHFVNYNDAMTVIDRVKDPNYGQ